MATVRAAPAPLAKRQRDLYEFIDAYTRERWYMPTLEEMSEALGLRSNNAVRYHLNALVRKGWLEQDQGRKRARRLMRPLVDASPRGLLARAGQLANEWQPPGIASLRDGGWDGNSTGWWLLELEVGHAEANETLLAMLEPTFIEASWQSSYRGGRHVYSWGVVPGEATARPLALRIVEPSANDAGLAAGGGS